MLSRVLLNVFFQRHEFLVVVMNAIIFQSIDHLSFWCIINQENGSHMAATCFKWRSPQPPNSPDHKNHQSHERERKRNMLFAAATGSVSLDLGPNEREVKNFHFLPAIIAAATFLFQNNFHRGAALSRWLILKWAHAPRTPLPLAAFPPPFFDSNGWARALAWPRRFK